MSAKPCFLVTALRGFGLSRSRRDLIVRFLDAGWQVVVATADDEQARSLTSLGVTLEIVPYVRGRLRPMADLAAYRSLRGIMRRYRPRLVHAFNGKPLILASFAVHAVAGAPVTLVATVTGLGYAFVAGGVNRKIAAAGFRIAARRLDAVVFQNDDDRDLFVDSGWLPAHRAHIIVGSGVDTVSWAPGPVRPAATSVVLMYTRLLWQKGVREFVEAAREVKRTHPDVRFLLAGEIDDNHPDSVPQAFIESAVNDNVIEYLGYLARPVEVLRNSSVCVFPSYYGEGCPRVVLEAAACGIPTIGADVAGTRQAIRHDETGLLVAPRDSGAVAESIRRLIDTPELGYRLGRAARGLAEREFAMGVILERHLQLYTDLGIEGVGTISGEATGS